jgi:Concanavalin A-like lectin/glucanases superfamily/Domain of unknown function (DUF2341)
MRRARLLLAGLTACGLGVTGTAVGPDGGGGGGGANPGTDAGAAAEAGGAIDGSLPPGPDGSVGSGWSYARTLTIDNSAQGALAAFPLLVVLDDTRVTYAHASASGADLRFTDAAGAALDYEIEQWNASGKSFVWVNVPSIAAHASTTIRMLYGNPSATDAESATKVWDASFVGVWHLVDAHDSTGKHASAKMGATSTTGQVGGALAFNGTSQYVDTMATEQLDSWTIEAWANATNAPKSNTGSWSGPLMRDNYNLQWDCNSSSYCASASVVLPSDNWQSASFGGPSSGAWHYLAATFDTSTLVAYVDGSQKNTQGGLQKADSFSSSAKIAAERTLTQFFSGKVDEVRISNAVRTADWISAQAKSMADSGFVSYGPEQNN